MKTLLSLSLLLILSALVSHGEASWPQFRGLNGSGVAQEGNPPVQFGPATNLVWRTPLPPGSSSPCIWDERIFLTGFEDSKLETFCLHRSDGKLLWRKQAPVQKVELFHPQEGSPAASTPATDGRRVYAYFGSCGMIAYDFDGVEQWRHLMPVAESFGGFGTGASPILAGGLVILNRDQVGGSEIVALDAANGRVAWKTDRGQSYGWCTPALWQHDGVQEIVLPASAVLKSYDLSTGAERWSIGGIAAATCSTPVVGEGLLFVSSWTTTDSSNAPPPFDSWLQQLDKDGDGALSLAETEGSPLRQMFQAFDLDRDQRITRVEYEKLRGLASRSRNILLAIRPGGKGDVTESHVAWSQSKGLPYVPSPLLYQGRLYLVKDGGMVSCFDAQTGKPLYLQERLGVTGSFYASPVAVHGRIYAASVPGIVTVFQAGDTLNVLARNELGERISATPAIVGDTLYLRTAGHLCAFRTPGGEK
jgi:outer membrane protein assembly factor BamB